MANQYDWAPTKSQQVEWLVSDLHDTLDDAQEKIASVVAALRDLTTSTKFDDLLEDLQDSIRKIEQQYPEMKGGE